MFPLSINDAGIWKIVYRVSHPKYKEWKGEDWIKDEVVESKLTHRVLCKLSLSSIIRKVKKSSNIC